MQYIIFFVDTCCYMEIHVTSSILSIASSLAQIPLTLIISSHGVAFASYDMLPLTTGVDMYFVKCMLNPVIVGIKSEVVNEDLD